MLLALAAIVSGLGLLVWAADRFVVGAAAMAGNLGVSPLLIGLTVVGFGTSAPEILVSVMASVQGNTGLAVGNAIGSNIANIGMILGATALVMPLTVHSDLLRREYPILLVVSAASAVALMDGTLDRADGIMLLVGLALTMMILVRIGLQGRTADPLVTEMQAEVPADIGMHRAIGLFLFSLALLILSSRLLVWGAVEVATAFGVSDLVIGLTIVAIGTSLPELAASIASALKGEPDLAIGNVIGSNIWNLLAVLGVPGLLAPGIIPAEAFSRDMLVMLGLTVALFVIGRARHGHGIIGRVHGSALLACFIVYQAWIVWQALPSTY